MKIVIIEDEPMAVRRLQQLLPAIDPKLEIIETLDSIKSTVRWFETNPLPDLAFFDIQLADGLSFEIFNKVSVNCPVIFTTAYDQYAIQAFKVNSVDYLLKPVTQEGLTTAINKFKSHTKTTPIDSDKLIQLLQQQSKTYKERFIVKVGDHLKTVLTTNISLVYSESKSTYCLHSGNQKHILDFTLDQVEELVDDKLFFRINRKYLVHIDAIVDIISYSNSRLKLETIGYTSDDLIVSREKVSLFKKWLDR